MSNKRRIIIILISVTMGSFFAFLLVRSRMGTLNHESWRQIIINFIFALAIVVVIGIVLRKKSDKM
jgi:ABC-type antimicrobial peptide transport system permease subunit